ncbi:CsbD family protein [Brasilonema sp. CT11]|nr:CsbD family protein [Brasilonema sp. CT11]
MSTEDRSAENRIEATAKNIEGKIQEVIGNITGDPKQKAEGKAKQAEAQVRHTTENIKDELKKNL